MSHSIKRIRTIALIGQSGAGKTTLAEALLAKAGAIPAAGSVERGTTVCDYTPLEKQLQHSLTYAYRDRRDRKAQFRRLWITRIGAAARQNGMSYSTFIHGLQASGSSSIARSWRIWP